MNISPVKENSLQSNLSFNQSNFNNNDATTGLVFIDPKVDDYAMLMTGVAKDLEVVLLDDNCNGIAQITQALKGRFNLSSLHIVAHGEAGKLWLGNGFIDSNTLEQYSDDLLSWAAALAPDADILLYGCKVAAGETGQQFVQLLSQLTGADVAASNNLTGSAALGGDWELEMKIGTVEAAIAFGTEALGAYNSVLSTFTPATNFKAGNQPQFVAINDLNGDGIPDLAVPNRADNTVSILLGTGTGTFGSPNNFAVGTYPFAVAVGNFNADGIPDLAVPNWGSNNVSILLGTGTGTFGAATNFNVGTSPWSVAVGDFNGDNFLDLVTANISSNNVSILLGAGNGSFGAATNFNVGATPQSVAVGDFNGDNILDLATANFSSNNVSILLGTGTGTFGAATNFSVGTNPYSVAVGDFNTDNILDLATANEGSNNVSILLGTGTGTFGAATNFSVGTGPRSVAVGDLNGDGKLDLATANGVGSDSPSNNVSILLGTGTGSFSPATHISLGTGPWTVAIADLNRDQKPDLATSNYWTDNVSILLNNTAPEIPAAWWKLDGTTGTTAADSAGIKDGILYNSPTPIVGKVDNALSFDGVNDYVVIPDNDALDFGTGDFAISTWIKTTDNQGVDVILDKRVLNAGAIQGYHLFNYDGKLGLQLADGLGWTNYVSNISVADGQWHQVTVSVDRDNPTGGQWYLDGKLVETFNPTGRQGSLSNSQALNLGSRFDNMGSSFNGSLDEVKLFNNTLSATDVANLYQTDMKASFPNRVGWWKLDGTTGTTTADSAGTKDAILHNSPTPTVGKVDNGLSFDGVNDYVEVADNNALDLGTGDFSISTWIKTTDNQGVDVILDKRVLNTGAIQGYHLFNYDGKVGLQLADGSGWTNYISNVSIADGQWHQVTVTVDRNNANGGQWYIDGNLAGTFNPTGRQGSLSNSQALMLGNRSDSAGGYFNGSLDEVQLFNKALSATEVKAIFQNQPLAKAIGPDFNRDGKGDILWRNSATGQNVVWQMDGTNLTTGVALTQVADANWNIVGTGDFNGDSKEDILWRNSATGQNVVWQMDGTNLTTGVALTPVADANWDISGTGDFNGDGKKDILWRNSTTGQNVVWLMDGTELATGVVLTPVADANWGISGTGDFNGNGQEDILWRNSVTGQNVVWLMDGTQLATGVELTPVADANWSIGGTGDYNNDGQVDILWRNGATGQNVAWLMNGTELATGVALTPVADSNWQIVA